jgi:L-iditol 2-dehydrogenase
VVSNSAPCGECRECRRQRENLCVDLAYLNGAFADHLLVPDRFAEVAVHPLPAGLPAGEAALAEPFACAVHCLEVLEPVLVRSFGNGDDPPRAVVFGAGPLGLLLVGLLARHGVVVTSADPHAGRLELAQAFGATRTTQITDRDAPITPSVPRLGFDLTIDATGSPAAWQSCLRHLDPGGVAVFFGGTAADVELVVDAQALHYSELSLLGVYHHRPTNVARALELLAARALPHELLITDELPLERLDEALQRMAERRALKVALRP